MCHRNSDIGAQRWLALAISVFVMSAMWIVSRTVAQEKERHGNPEAQKIINPVPSDDESIEAGKKLYRRYCASCHGPQAKGDGGMALAGGTPSNLVDEAWDYGSSDGEIFVVIRDGTSADMQGYKDRLTEKQIWQLVNFIRSLGPKQPNK